MYNQPMKRTNIYLPEEQLKDLAEIHAETGASVAEIVRRAITSYVGAWRGKQQEGQKALTVEVQDRR